MVLCVFVWHHVRHHAEMARRGGKRNKHTRTSNHAFGSAKKKQKKTRKFRWEVEEKVDTSKLSALPPHLERSLIRNVIAMAKWRQISLSRYHIVQPDGNFLVNFEMVIKAPLASRWTVTKFHMLMLSTFFLSHFFGSNQIMLFFVSLGSPLDISSPTSATVRVHVKAFLCSQAIILWWWWWELRAGAFRSLHSSQRDSIFTMRWQ